VFFRDASKVDYTENVLRTASSAAFLSTAENKRRNGKILLFKQNPYAFKSAYFMRAYGIRVDFIV